MTGTFWPGHFDRDILTRTFSLGAFWPGTFWPGHFVRDILSGDIMSGHRTPIFTRSILFLHDVFYFYTKYFIFTRCILFFTRSILFYTMYFIFTRCILFFTRSILVYTMYFIFTRSILFLHDVFYFLHDSLNFLQRSAYFYTHPQMSCLGFRIYTQRHGVKKVKVAKWLTVKTYFRLEIA